MRQQQQQQQKSRNRNRGRKSSNPLSRNFESNGPDVKIRGNANHIAEKYSMLARDAFTSDDTVMAENYFQHAEHYFRIVAAAQQNHTQSGEAGNVQRELGNVQENKSSGSASNDNSGSGSQPNLEEIPAEINLKEANIVIGESQVVKPDNIQMKEERPRVRRSGRRTTIPKKVSYESSSKDDNSALSKTLPSSDENKLKQQEKQLSEEITSRSDKDENLSSLDKE